MVRPYDKANKANRDHRINHAQIAKDRLFREGRDDMADNTKGRQNHDINFGVTKEPE